MLIVVYLLNQTEGFRKRRYRWLASSSSRNGYRRSDRDRTSLLCLCAATIASGESEEGAFIFTQNPRQGQLNLRVGSYKLP